MKKFYVGIFVLLVSLCSSVQAHPTEEEEIAILKQCLVPQELQKKLDTFFKDKDVADVFFNIPRRMALQPHWRQSKMKPNAEGGCLDYAEKTSGHNLIVNGRIVHILGFFYATY